MQRIDIEKETTFVYYHKRDEERTLHFNWEKVLPEGDTLVLNTEFGTLSYLSIENNRPCLIAQQVFTESEMSALVPLMKMYPYYCPYEVLYTSFYDSDITEENVNRSRRRLQRAMTNGTIEVELRSVRGILSRIRPKLRAIGLDVVAIMETGYILFIRTKPKPKALDQGVA